MPLGRAVSPGFNMMMMMGVPSGDMGFYYYLYPADDDDDKDDLDFDDFKDDKKKFSVLGSPADSDAGDTGHLFAQLRCHPLCKFCCSHLYWQVLLCSVMLVMI